MTEILENASPPRRRIRRPSLLLSAASNWAVLVINAVIAIMLTPFIIAHIGKSNYGVWSLVSGIIGYYSLFRMGVGTAIMRFISLNDGRGDKAAVSGTFSTAMAIYVAVAGIVAVSSFFCAGLIAEFFRQGAEFRLLIRIMGLTVALGCPCAVLESALRAREEFVVINSLMLALTVVRGIAMGASLAMGYGLIGMAMVCMMLSVLDIIVMAFIFRLTCPDIKLRISLVHSSHLRYLLSFGAMVTLVSLGTTLRFDSDRAVIGRMLSMDLLGSYAVIATLLVNARSLLRATTRVLNPRFSFLDGQGDAAQTLRLFIHSTRATAMLSTLLCMMMFSIGPSFVHLWVGHGFDAAFPALLILSAAYVVGLSQTTSHAFLNGIGKQGVVAAMTITEGIASIGMSILLAGRFSLTGIAIGMAIPMVIVQGIAIARYTTRFLDLSVLRYYRKCLLKPWAFGGIITVCLQGFLAYSHLNTWLRLIVAAMTMVLAYGVLCFKFILEKHEQQNLLGRLTFFRLATS